jgi:DNA helicase-4
MTIHKSKGLEADVVIIINLVDDMMGFPSKLEDDKILSLVSSKTDKYPYSEERRLFYVGLTRTKGYVYLYVPKYNRSVFVKEIEKCRRCE